MGKRRFILIDAHSLAYRAYYALPADLSTSSGQVINAVYGFASMLIKLLGDFEPYGAAVAFDRGKPTYRLEQYADYKAHRPPMPDTLREQIDIIKGMLDTLGMYRLEMEGYEADDLLATLARGLDGSGCEAYIVTSDKDILQLVDDNVSVVANRKGLTDVVLYDREKVIERYGVPPERIVDFLALKGDASDNIPGVPGIGDKTAVSLISEFGDLDAIYERLEEVGSEKTRRLLREGREEAFLSRDLARLVTDLPLGLDPDALALKAWDSAAARSLFEQLEFRTLLERLEELGKRFFAGPQGEEAGAAAPEPPDRSWVEICDEAGVEELREAVREAGTACVYAVMQGAGYTGGSLRGLAVAAGEEGFYAGCEGGRLEECLRALLESGAAWVGHSAKELQVQMLKSLGEAPAFTFDSELASYLIDPASQDRGLERLARDFLRVDLEPGGGGQLSLEAPPAEGAGEAVCRVRCLPGLRRELERRLSDSGMEALNAELELPLQLVLARMESAGIGVDVPLLRALSREAGSRLEELQESVYELAGEPFNLNSPQQLSRILFEVLGLPVVKRTKTGYSTDVEVLEALADLHPVIPLILENRELTKLKGTYLDALPRLVDPVTGRLHTSFNQTVTATGRLSSSNPNLQNIPVRTPFGARIREAFVPGREGDLLVAADYSQIELRILAHLSGDPGLIEAFTRGEDIHAATAAEVFGVPVELVTPEHRRRAKAINFGLLYGMGSHSLSRQLDIGEEEARDYIDTYFERYPGVREYLDAQVERAARDGYVETILKRRRKLPELLSPGARLKSLGERLARNSPIQGSAADVIKLAMLGLDAALRARDMRSRLILQVHDELLVEAAQEELPLVVELVREKMEGAVELSVPLRVEVSSGRSWKEAKP